jgi:hypothetical protein
MSKNDFINEKASVFGAPFDPRYEELRGKNPKRVCINTFATYRIPRQQTTPPTSEQLENNGKVCAFLQKEGDHFGFMSKKIDGSIPSLPHAVMSAVYDLFLSSFGKAPNEKFQSALANVSYHGDAVIFSLHISGVSKTATAAAQGKSPDDFGHFNHGTVSTSEDISVETREALGRVAGLMGYAADPHVMTPVYIGHF